MLRIEIPERYIFVLCLYFLWEIVHQYYGICDPVHDDKNLIVYAWNTITVWLLSMTAW
jgi:hypothetical protein